MTAHRCMALDHAGAVIRCSAVCPGYGRSEMLEHFFDHQPVPAAARSLLASMALSSGRVFDWGG